MKLEFYRYNLELKDTFTISHGSRNFQPTLIVAITQGLHTGYGEATATSYYGVSVDKMQSDIKDLEPLLKDHINKTPEEIWTLTWPILKDNPFAQCALDMALHDLHGKRKGLPLYRLWNLNLDSIPLTNYTIGLDSVEKMIQKIRDFPWPRYKIKLGTRDDLKIVQELRKHTEAVFRVDANAAWTVDQAIENSIALKKLNVEFLEQPLKTDDWDGMKELYNKSALPLIADESCTREEDIKECASHFNGINIKLTKCGGLTPGRRMILEGKSLGLKVMVGCMTESTVGISAIAQLLPLLDYVDMDGALLLKKDIASGVKIYDKQIHFPKRNGTGAELYDK